MKEKVFTHGRKWLNPPAHDDTGAVSWYVSADQYDATAHFQIRDCGRQIDLNFCVNNQKDLDQRIKKFNTLIDVLTQMRDKMGDALKYHEKAAATREQANSSSQKAE